MIYCKHCPRVTASSKDVARVQGWRMHTGLTQGGGFLDDVVCPRCAGQEEPDPPSWNIECSTCFWNYLDDEDELPPLVNIDEAEAEAREHVCQPWMRLQAPNTDTWVDLFLPENMAKLREQWKRPPSPPQPPTQGVLTPPPHPPDTRS